MNEEELRNLMFTAQQDDMGPFVIRYPRGNGVMTEWKTKFKSIKPGSGRRIKTGNDIAILTIGHVGNYAVMTCEALEADGISVAHYDMRFIKPLDEMLLHEVFKKFDKVITVEDGCIMGGMGSAVLEFMSDNNYSAQVIRLGIPDTIIEHGEQPQLHEECGYHPKGIAAAARKIADKQKNVLAS